MSEEKHKAEVRNRGTDRNKSIRESIKTTFVMSMVLMFALGFLAGFFIADYVKVTGFAFDPAAGSCAAPGAGQDWVIQDNCNITDETLNISQGYDIIINNSAVVKFTNCNITLNPTESSVDGIIYVQNGASLTIEDSTLDSGSAENFSIDVASGTTFESTGSVYDGLYWIYADSPITNFVGNDIIDSFYSILFLAGAGGSIIQDSNFTTSVAGMYLYGVQDVTIDNIRVNGSGRAVLSESVGVDNIVINNSDLRSNDNIVVQLKNGPNNFAIVNSFIHKTEGDGCEPDGGDPFSGTGRGGGCGDYDSLIQCFGAHTDHCENLRIENNVLKRSASGWDNGTSIYVEYGDGVIIKDNSINASKQAGIRFWFTDNSMIENNNINKTLSYIGIELQDSDNNEIIDNTIFGNQNRDCHADLVAIDIHSGSQNNLFVGNDVTTASTGIDFGNGLNNTFANGTIDSSCNGTVYEAIVADGGEGSVLNTTLAHDTVNATGTGAVYVQWYLDVCVDDFTDPVEDVTVEIYNKNGVLEQSGLTGVDGCLEDKPVTETNHTSTGNYSMSDYVINVSKAGYTDNSTTLNMTDVAANTQVDLSMLLVDHTLTVDLVSPEDSISVYAGFIDFNFTVESPDDINNCSLYFDKPSGVEFIKENDNIMTGEIENITVNISEGTYFWMINCKSDYNSSNSSIYTLLVTPSFGGGPSVSLISPADDDTSTSYSVTFTYNVTADANIANCSLIIGNDIKETDDNVTKNTDQTFSNTFGSEGVYTWSVNCTDTDGETGSSGERTITIELDGGDSDGDGGGGPPSMGPSCDTYSYSLNITLPETLLFFTDLKECDKIWLEVMYPDFTKINYTIKVEDVVEDSYINLSIDSGDPIQLYKMWMKKIDLNEDGTEDIFFRLNNMPSGTKANLTIGNIVEYPEGVNTEDYEIIEIIIDASRVANNFDVDASDSVVTDDGKDGKKVDFVDSGGFMIVGSIALVLIVAAIILFFFRHKGSEKPKPLKASQATFDNHGVIDVDKLKSKNIKIKAPSDPDMEGSGKAKSSKKRK